jgi:peptide/nickel transport system permease protein
VRVCSGSRPDRRLDRLGERRHRHRVDVAVLTAAILRPHGVRGWLVAHPMAAYFLRRLATYLVTLWGAVTAVFFFFFYRLIPGNPIKQWIFNLEQNHVVSASRAVVDHYNEVFGLKGNLLSQYLHFMYQLVVFRNFGPSLIGYPAPAQDVITQAW